MAETALIQHQVSTLVEPSAPGVSREDFCGGMLWGKFGRDPVSVAGQVLLTGMEPCTWGWEEEGRDAWLVGRSATSEGHPLAGAGLLLDELCASMLDKAAREEWRQVLHLDLNAGHMCGPA